EAPAQAAAAHRGLHVQVFQVQPAPAQERREVVEEQGERVQRAVVFRDQAFRARTRAEQLRLQQLGGRLHEVRELLVLGQFADEADDGGNIATRGETDR